MKSTLKNDLFQATRKLVNLLRSLLNIQRKLNMVKIPITDEEGDEIIVSHNDVNGVILLAECNTRGKSPVAFVNC